MQGKKVVRYHKQRNRHTHRACERHESTTQPGTMPADTVTTCAQVVCCTGSGPSPAACAPT